MLETAWFTFAAPPKCGCTWFLQVIGESGVPVPDKHASTRVHHPGRAGKKPTITFLRPFDDWLRSYYQNMRYRLVGRDSLVDSLQSLPWESFDGFCREYFDRMPKRVPQIFAEYSSDYALDLYKTPDSLLDLFDDLGVDYNREVAATIKPSNVTADKLVIPQWVSNAFAEAQCVTP